MRILTRCVCCICMCTYLCMCVYIYPRIWHIWLIVQWLCFCCCSSCAAHTKFIDCRIHTCRMLQPLWCVVVKMARISCVSQRKWPQCTHTHTHARSSCSNSSSRHRVLVYLNFRSSWPALSLSLAFSFSCPLSRYVFLGGQRTATAARSAYTQFLNQNHAAYAQSSEIWTHGANNFRPTLLTLIRRRHKFHFYTHPLTDPSFSTKVTYDFFPRTPLRETFLPAFNFNPEKCGVESWVKGFSLSMCQADRLKFFCNKLRNHFPPHFPAHMQ